MEIEQERIKLHTALDVAYGEFVTKSGGIQPNIILFGWNEFNLLIHSMTRENGFLYYKGMESIRLASRDGFRFGVVL